jgi:hypothetical protein
MSLLNRKPRPLLRDAASLRDDRLFIVACDDQYAPQQYFDCFQFTRVKIHVVPTEDGTSVAEYVLDRLLQFDHESYDERWMLLDTDHCTEGTHLKGFTKAMSRARKEGIKVALSRPCFELWLLLHCVDEGEVIALPSATKVEQALRSELGQYDKTRLKAEHYPFRSVAEACKRARRLDATVPAAKFRPAILPVSTSCGNRSPKRLFLRNFPTNSEN